MKSAKYAAVGLMAVALAIGLLGTYRHVFAQEESRQGNPPGAVLASPAETSSDPATNQVLLRNYLVHGTRSGTSFPAEYIAVDPVKTVECPGPAGTCTIAAEMWVQTGNSTTASNNYVVCLYVDGVSVYVSDRTNGCHYTANTPADGTFVEGSELNQLSGVKVGNHTVQTFLYTENGARVYNYNIAYHVYKP